MKKFISIFSIFLLLSFSTNTIKAAAQQKTFSEGFYSINDLDTMENVSYNVQNISEFKSFMLVFDNDQKIEQAIRLEPKSQKYALKPFKQGDRIVILGSGQLTFTT